LGDALVNLSGSIRADEIKPLIEVFHREEVFSVRVDLGVRLAAFGAKLPREYVVDVLCVALFATDELDDDLFQKFTELLTLLHEKQDLVQLLKNPFCTGKAQEAALNELEKRFAAEKKDVQFNGDISELVKQGEALDLDLETPPRRPEFLRK